MWFTSNSQQLLKFFSFSRTTESNNFHVIFLLLPRIILQIIKKLVYEKYNNCEHSGKRRQKSIFALISNDFIKYNYTFYVQLVKTCCKLTCLQDDRTRTKALYPVAVSFSLLLKELLRCLIDTQLSTRRRQIK